MKTKVMTNSIDNVNGHVGKSSSSRSGKIGITVLLALAFLGLVMFLSYLFISGTLKS
jgi:hypothetical protein